MNDQTRVYILNGVQGYWVGIEKIWVPAYSTVAQLIKVLKGPDNLLQHYQVYRGRQVLQKQDGLLQGDFLRVEDELNRIIEYQVTFVEESQPGWDMQTYLKIERELNNHLPIFPKRSISILDSRFAPLIDVRNERFAVGNDAGDPTQLDSPLVYAEHQVTYFGDAINAAIVWLNRQGGGVLRIPASSVPYHTGAIRLLSHVRLQIDEGAIIKFMREPTNVYYPIVLTSYEGNDLLNFSPCIYALGQHDVAITGGGELDGQEDMYNWRPWKKGYWGCDCVDSSVVDADYGNNGRLNAQNFNDDPVDSRLYTDDGEVCTEVYTLVDGKPRSIKPQSKRAYRSVFRPNFIEFNHCNNIIVSDLKIRHTPFWAVHPLNSSHILIQGINLYSDRTKDFESHGWNNDDGIDPESCSNVVITHCRVIVSDDGIAIKAGRNRDGLMRRNPCTDLIIRDSFFGNDGGESAAISIGSEMSAGVQRVFVEQCCFGGVGLSQLLKLKTNAVRGGYIKDIYVRKCSVIAVNRGLIQIDTAYRETVSFPQSDRHLPCIYNINLTDIVTDRAIHPIVNLIDLVSSMSNSPACDITLRRVIWYTPKLTRELHAFDRAPFLRNIRLINVLFIDKDSSYMIPITTKQPQLKNVRLHTNRGSLPIDKVSFERLSLSKCSLRVSGELTYLPFSKIKSITVNIGQQRITCYLQEDGQFYSEQFILSLDSYFSGDPKRMVINVQGGLINQTWCYEFI